MESYEGTVATLWRVIDDLYNWFGEEYPWNQNYYRLCISYPKDNNRLNIFRDYMDVDYDEKLLLVSMYKNNSGNERHSGVETAITNRAIHINLVDEKNKFISYNSKGKKCHIKWSELEHFEYKDKHFILYCYNGETYTLAPEYFFWNPPHVSVCQKLCSYLTEIAQMVHLQSIRDNGEYEKALELVKKLVNEHNDHTLLHFDYGACILDYELEKENPDESNLKIALSEFKKVQSVYNDLPIYKEMAATNMALGNTWTARCDLLRLMEDEDYSQYAMEMLEKIEKESDVLDYYVDYDYKDRKLIMPIDDKHIAGCVTDGIDVFRMSCVPSCIKFPIGHPVSGELYIGHPYKPELYVPYDTHEDVFFIDKVNELCNLLQCLGATEITIESIKGRNVNELYNNSFSVNGSVGIKAFSAGGSYENNYSRDTGETSNSMRTMRRKYDPIYRPYVPEGLVWYPESTEWQRLAHDRINGNMLEYEECLSTLQTRIVNSTEQDKIKASAKILWAKANVNVETNTKSNFKEAVETEWKVSVKFRSIREMKGYDTYNKGIVATNKNAIAESCTFTDSEKEYLETLKECVTEESIITESERRLLEKLRTKLGISENRAKELEQSFSKPSLTSEEQEYLDEYKSILADGEITDRERKLIDKIRRMSGISEERAKEIEEMV